MPTLSPAEAPLGGLEEAALRAACLPHLQGGGRDVQDARCAVITVIGNRWSVRELADRLGILERIVGEGVTEP